MDVTVLVNESAGDQEHSGVALRALIESAGHRVRVGSSENEALDRALARPGDLVAVAGGDGTVARVARRLVGQDVPMALLPLGTANNIATSFGIHGAPEELVPRWTAARPLRLDLGRATGPWGERTFVESVGLGLLTRLMAPADAENIYDTRDARARVRRLACSMHPARWRLELDGEDLSGEYLLLEAMNIRCAGPNLWLSPGADAGDGQLDVVTAGAAEREALLAVAEASGTARPPLPARRGRRLRAWCAAADLHVDDQPAARTSGTGPPALFEVELTGESVTILV